MISPVNTSKVCQLSGCSSTSGTCYKETHSHSYSCPSGYSTSCSYGYSSSASKTCSCGATSGTCYKCTSNSTPTCPAGYVKDSVLQNDYGVKYTNNAQQFVADSSGYGWCFPQSNIYTNSSMSSFSTNSDGHITSTGTYTVSNTPLIRTRISGTLIINGDVALSDIFLMSSSAKLVINGNATLISKTINLTKGAKFCPASIDTSKITNRKTRSYWCVKNWSGWGDETGDGMCDFDGECYY